MTGTPQENDFGVPSWTWPERLPAGTGSSPTSQQLPGQTSPQPPQQAPATVDRFSRIRISVTGLISAIASAMAAFGMGLSVEQGAAIAGLVGAAFAVVASFRGQRD